MPVLRVVAAAVVAVTVGHAVTASGGRHDSAVELRVDRLAPPPEGAERPAPPAIGNLGVSIPLTNTSATLRRVCKEAIEGSGGDAARRDVAALADETGGTADAARRWCQQYLALGAAAHDGDRP